MVSVTSYVYSDPLLLGLVCLNIIPCLLLSLLHVIRSGKPSHGKIPRTFVLKPGDAALWQILDKAKSKAPSRPVMFVTGMKVGSGELASQGPENSRLASVHVQHERLDAGDAASRSEHCSSPRVETIPEEEVLAAAEACGDVAATTSTHLKKRLGRTASPSSPFDWMGSGAYDKLGSGAFDEES